jgi:hypothetical protein
LRRIFEHKRDQITEKWRKLHSDEPLLSTQYCSSDQIKKNEVGGSCSTYGEKEKRIHDIAVET